MDRGRARRREIGLADFAPAAGVEAATTSAPFLRFTGPFGSVTLPRLQPACFSDAFALVRLSPASFGTLQVGGGCGVGDGDGDVDSEGCGSTSGTEIVGGAVEGVELVKETGAEQEEVYFVSTRAENCLVVPFGTETARPGDSSSAGEPVATAASFYAQADPRIKKASVTIEFQILPLYSAAMLKRIREHNEQFTTQLKKVRFGTAQ